MPPPRAVRLVVVLVAIAVCTSLLIVRSVAAFTAQTQNVDNRLQAGLVKLTDNVPGSTLFAVDAMVPGEVAQRCIQVVYGGSVPADVTVPRTSAPASPTWSQTGTPAGWAWATIAFR